MAAQNSVTGPEIHTVEYHTAGEPFRIVTAGTPLLQGRTVLDKRQWCETDMDATRSLLINEPRGHADMYGGFPTSPDDEHGDLGVVFFHKDGFSTACGHGTIALVTWALEEGIIEAQGSESVEVVVDVPSGRLHTVARLDELGRVASVRFWNVPSFVTSVGLPVETSLGDVVIDISFGGAFYASVSLDESDLCVDPPSLAGLIQWSREIRSQLQGHPAATHRSEDRFSGVYGVIFHETVVEAPLHQRNVTVFTDGEVDRSPCGSGTSARLALLHHRGVLAVGENFSNEGIAGGVFNGRVESLTDIDGLEAVTTSVEGSAYRTGSATFTVDERDPLGRGFQLR